MSGERKLTVVTMYAGKAYTLLAPTEPMLGIVTTTTATALIKNLQEKNQVIVACIYY